jgi:2-oxoglutarate ferredoxin oxidoreductase subunit gamma
VVMNKPSLFRFQNLLESGGVLFINSSLVDAETTRGDIEVIRVSANTIAEELGSPKAANMVMLGAFIKKSNLVSLETVIEELKNVLQKKKSLIEINTKALKTGYNLF